MLSSAYTQKNCHKEQNYDYQKRKNLFYNKASPLKLFLIKQLNYTQSLSNCQYSNYEYVIVNKR